METANLNPISEYPNFGYYLRENGPSHVQNPRQGEHESAVSRSLGQVLMHAADVARPYTGSVCLDSAFWWLRVSDMENYRVAVKLVRGFAGHLWAMYAVYWVASGHYGLAGVCATIAAWVIFGL